MVRVLLDTCVLSELQRPQGSAQVRTQVEASLPEDLYISAITFGELVKGIALVQTALTALTRAEADPTRPPSAHLSRSSPPSMQRRHRHPSAH